MFAWCPLPSRLYPWWLPCFPWLGPGGPPWVPFLGASSLARFACSTRSRDRSFSSARLSGARAPPDWLGPSKSKSGGGDRTEAVSLSLSLFIQGLTPFRRPPLRPLFGLSWALLGFSWGGLGAVLEWFRGSPGAVLRAFWRVWKVSRHKVAYGWDVEATWKRLGVVLEPSWALPGPLLGCPWPSLGSSCGPHGVSWGSPGAS